MARTTGPLMSLAASGSVAKTLTFSHWKGRPYVRQLVTPSNPKSQGQTYTRAMMRFLSQAWNDLSDSDKATWDTLAKQGNFSGFNAFTRFNMMQWTQQLGPQQAADGSSSNLMDTLGTLTAVGGVRQIQFSQVITTKVHGWGFLVVVPPVGTTGQSMPDTRLIVDTHAFVTGNTVTGSLSGLTPGTYDFSIRQFADAGNFGSFSTIISGIVVT